MSVACTHCGVGLAPEIVLYDSNGLVTCQRCLDAGQVEESRAEASDKVRSVAYANVLVGLLAFFFNPFLIISAGTSLNKRYVLRSLEDQNTAKRLARSVGRMRTALDAGVVLGVLAGVAYLVRIFSRAG